MRGVDAAPTGRKFPLPAATQLDEQLVETLADAVELGMSVALEPVPALQAEREAEVAHFERVLVAPGLLLHVGEHQEDALAALDVLMKRRGERMGWPRAGLSPGRGERDVVERDAQGVVAGARLILCRRRDRGTPPRRPASPAWRAGGARPRRRPPPPTARIRSATEGRAEAPRPRQSARARPWAPRPLRSRAGPASAPWLRWRPAALAPADAAARPAWAPGRERPSCRHRPAR